MWIKQDGRYLNLEINSVVSEKTNFVASAYGRTVKALIDRAVSDNGVYYCDNKKITDLLTREGLQLPKPLVISDYINSMHQTKEKVNSNAEYFTQSNENSPKISSTITKSGE